MKSIVKINIKIIIIFLVSILLFCTFNNYFVYADPPGYSPKDDKKEEETSKDERVITKEFDTKDWDPTTSIESSASEEQKLKDIGNRIIGTIQVIGSLVSVIALIIIGIRYMYGSVEEKAQYKETMIPYIIGAVLVFGITTTLKIVYNIAQSVN